MTPTPESKVKKDIKAYLKSIGAYYVTVPGGAYGTNGSPDMVVCYKGRFIALEGKANDGKQADWQKLRQRQAERAGGIYVLAWTVDDVKDAISSLEPSSAPAED